jgi:large subunit ribosomal protein L10e
MAGLRPARTFKYNLAQSWSRFSRRKPRKSYVKAMPHTSLLVFNMGKQMPEQTLTMNLVSQEHIQIRSNAIESARLTCNKFLEANIPGGYYFKILVYPHNVVREHRMASGAGADRISKGMTMAFGTPVSICARIKVGQPIFMVKTKPENRNVVATALKRATSKMSGNYKVVAS